MCKRRKVLLINTYHTRNRSQLDYKGDRIQIFSDLSPITLAKQRNLKWITAHLQHHRIAYFWGFPLCLVATKMASSMSSGIYIKIKLSSEIWACLHLQKKTFLHFLKPHVHHLFRLRSSPRLRERRKSPLPPLIINMLLPYVLVCFVLFICLTFGYKPLPK